MRMIVYDGVATVCVSVCMCYYFVCTVVCVHVIVSINTCMYLDDMYVQVRRGRMRVYAYLSSYFFFKIPQHNKNLVLLKPIFS